MAEKYSGGNAEDKRELVIAPQGMVVISGTDADSPFGANGTVSADSDSNARRMWHE